MNEMELLREMADETPPPVLAAVRLMYGGAAGTAVQLIAALAFVGDINAYHLTVLGHHLTTPSSASGARSSSRWP